MTSTYSQMTVMSFRPQPMTDGNITDVSRYKTTARHDRSSWWIMALACCHLMHHFGLADEDLKTVNTDINYERISELQLQLLGLTCRMHPTQALAWFVRSSGFASLSRPASLLMGSAEHEHVRCRHA